MNEVGKFDHMTNNNNNNNNNYFRSERDLGSCEV